MMTKRETKKLFIGAFEKENKRQEVRLLSGD
jgi:hypothetical protein